MSFYALAPKHLRETMKAEEQKKRDEEKKEEKENEANAAATENGEEKKPGSEVKEIYEHPQSRLFSKMAALVGGKPVSNLPIDPTSAPGPDLPVLDRKLEEDEERLKKDNRRWRGIIYLTVAVSLIILCLVVAQVISSVTSTKNPLPNIDVSEPGAKGHLRPEPLVASMPSLAEVNGGSAVAVSEPVETDVVEIETIVEVDGEESGGEVVVGKEDVADLEGQQNAPVSLDDGEGSEKGSTAKTSSTTPPSTAATTKRKPFFLPIMFGRGEITLKNPMAEFLRGSPPFRGQTARPRTIMELLFRRQPEAPPPVLNQQETMIISDMAEVEPDDDFDEDPFFDDVLRGMQRLLQTVTPLLEKEPLPDNVSFNRRLPPSARFLPRLPPPRHFVPPQARGFPPAQFQQQTSPSRGRSFSHPPAAFRPGPFRTPVSVVPPQPTNQRPFPPRSTNHRVFPPQPTNQRVFPPRGPTPQHNFHQQPHVNHNQRPFSPPPFATNLHQSGSSRHYNNNPHIRPQRPHLVGNPLYSYPNTATGIQDILHFIGQEKPHNGHGAYNSYSPNNRHFVSDNNERFHGNGYHSNNHRNNEGYSGPIYPPGYEGPGAQLGSSEQPFHLMLDVYPAPDSDRYSKEGGNDGVMFEEIEIFPGDDMVFPESMRNSLANVFPDDMPLPDVDYEEENDAPVAAGSSFPDFIVPQGRGLPFEIPTPHEEHSHPHSRPSFEDNIFLNPHSQPQEKAFQHEVPHFQLPEERKIQHEVGPNHHMGPQRLGFANEQHLQPFVAIHHEGTPHQEEQPVENSPERVPVFNYAPTVQDRFIPEHPQENHPMGGMHSPQNAQFLRHQEVPNVKTFPEDIRRPQGRGFPQHLITPPGKSLPHESHFPDESRFPHESRFSHEVTVSERVVPGPINTHREIRLPHRPHIMNRNEDKPHHMPPTPPQLHSQHLSEVREVPELAFIREQKGMPEIQRTPLYELLLSGAPKQHPGHFIEHTHLPESRKGDGGQHPMGRVYFPQEERKDEGFKHPLPLTMENPFLRKRFSPKDGPVRQGRSFDGNPWLF